MCVCRKPATLSTTPVTGREVSQAQKKRKLAERLADQMKITVASCTFRARSSGSFCGSAALRETGPKRCPNACAPLCCWNFPRSRRSRHQEEEEQQEVQDYTRRSLQAKGVDVRIHSCVAEVASTAKYSHQGRRSSLPWSCPGDDRQVNDVGTALKPFPDAGF